MLKNNHSDVKSDMLTISSDVREVLRALYFYGPDYIMIRMGGGKRLIHKEQLVSLLELGKASSSIEDIMSAPLNDPISARMQLEDIPLDTFLLVFTQKESGKAGHLSRMTFEEYRENVIKEAETTLPDWWGTPLPLLYIDEERVVLNEHGIRLMPCDAAVLAKQTESMLRDRVITIREKKRERTFSLRPLDEKTYLIEDISGDVEMAEDLVWWAAAGKAFYRRLEENGAVVRRLSPFEKPSGDAAEVIPCSWEGELVGSVVIGLPGESSKDIGKEPAAPITPAADAAPKTEKKKRARTKTTVGAKSKPETESAAFPGEILETEKPPQVKKRGRKPKSESKEKIEPEIIETQETTAKEGLAPGNLASLNKNAARKAYGGTAVRRTASEDGQKIKG